MPVKSNLQLSIILPIYNVAPYVEKCIRSLEDQDLPKDSYEIICVNDGSPDNSRQIVEKLQLEFPNIILINQENQGVSMARNNGMAMASGDYLIMIDPDDYIVPDSLQEKINFVVKNKLDVGVCAYTILNVKNEPIFYFNPPFNLKTPLTGIDYFNSYLKGKVEIMDPDRSVAIFYKREFLNDNNLFYLSDVPYLEDGEFLYRVYCLAKKVLFLNDQFYMRTTRIGSATNSKLIFHDRAKKGFLKAARNLKSFQSDFDITSKEFKFLNQPLAKFFFLYLTGSNRYWFLPDYFRIARSIKNEFPKIGHQESSVFYSKFAKHYNRSLFNFYFQYCIYNVFNTIKTKIWGN